MDEKRLVHAIIDKICSSVTVSGTLYINLTDNSKWVSAYNNRKGLIYEQKRNNGI